MEVYLYRCEVCGSMVASNVDHGRTVYNDCCGTCKTWTYYEKVEMRADPSKRYDIVFYVPTAEECKKDDNKKDTAETSIGEM